MSNDRRDGYSHNQYGIPNSNDGSYLAHLQGFDQSSSSSSNYMIESLMYGSMDYDSLAKAFGLSPSSSQLLSSIEGNNNNKSQVLQEVGGGGGGGNSTNSPPRDHEVAPNSSVSFSSNDHPIDSPGRESNKESQPAAGSEGEESSKKVSKAKKKVEKKEREAKFAFMTKSEVDHLEDGYRWRKYGQKAVKNSPYPRSYYRCTTQKCTVKKRVERSFQDPTIVITTYEGQHNHPIPATLRGSGASMFSSSYSLSPFGAAAFPHELLLQLQPPLNNVGGSAASYNAQNLNLQLLHHHQVPDYGLLQDIVPSMFFKGEPR